MRNVERLIVAIDLSGKEIEVGELVRSDRKIYFKYYPDFIDTGIQISPIKLPLSTEILSPDTTIFDGLFGVFNDSLPDGWGRLLLDRALLKRAISLSAITPLDRLSFVGRTGMGALIYKPPTDLNYNPLESLELDSIAAETQKVLAGYSTEIIDALFTLGGSSGGARPKIFVGYDPLTDRLISDTKDLPKGYEPWIIKFSSSSDPGDIAQIEYAYYKMAMDAGLTMNECKLFKGASGKSYFGTKRFDRQNGRRIHMHSASGLMHDNYRLSNMDYGHVMDCAFRLEQHIKAYEKVLRLAAFNVYAHNRDDHSKNISFLMNAKGEWMLAPAYDLTFSFSSHGFHSTTVAGEGKSPGRKQLLELANIFNVKNPNQIVDQVREALTNWKHYAEESGVGKASIELINKTLRR